MDGISFTHPPLPSVASSGHDIPSSLIAYLSGRTTRMVGFLLASLQTKPAKGTPSKTTDPDPWTPLTSMLLTFATAFGFSLRSRD